MSNKISYLIQVTKFVPKSIEQLEIEEDERKRVRYQDQLMISKSNEYHDPNAEAVSVLKAELSEVAFNKVRSEVVKHWETSDCE